MRISTRILWVISGVSCVVMSLLALTGYFILKDHQQVLFFRQEEQRISLLKERLNAENLSELEKTILPAEKDYRISVSGNKAKIKDSLKQNYPAPFIEELFRTGKANFMKDSLQGTAQIIEDSKEKYILLVVASDEYGLNQLSYIKWVLLFFTLLGVAAIALTGKWVVQRSLAPLNAKIEKAKRIGEGHFGERLSVQNEKDELGQMAIAFNEMFNRLENVFQTQRQFIGNASHEIRNPLTTILGEADLALEKDRNSAYYQKSLKSIRSSAERLNLLLENLLKLAQTSLVSSTVLSEEVRVDELLFDVQTEIGKSYPNRIEIEFETEEELFINGNAPLLQSAIGNIVQNACKFSGTSQVKIMFGYNKKDVWIKIIDKGMGIEAAHLSEITKPLFRGENARGIEGFGLGLALAQKIIEIHQGNLAFHSNPHGTTVHLTFPVAIQQVV